MTVSDSIFHMTESVFQKKIIEELPKLLLEHGFSHVKDAVGYSHR